MSLGLTVNPPIATPTFQGFVDAAVNAAVARLLGGAAPASDTLKELADLIAAQATSDAASFLTKAAAAKVATTGVYSDLTGKPSIPTTPGQVGAEPAGLSAATFSAISSQIATAVAGVVAGAPAALDTLVEIAAQLQADESGAAALATLVATKQNATQVAAAIATQAASDAAAYLTKQAAGLTYVAIPAGGQNGQVLGLVNGAIAWVTPATTTPATDGALLTESGDFLALESGDLLLAA